MRMRNFQEGRRRGGGLVSISSQQRWCVRFHGSLMRGVLTLLYRTSCISLRVPNSGYGHTYVTSRSGMSRELRFRAETVCSYYRDIYGRRYVLWPRAHQTSRWTATKPEMGQSRTTRRIDSYDHSARCFIIAWATAGVVINARYGEKKASLFLSLPFTDTRYVYFVRARKPAAALFFSNNGTIFGAAEMEIYLITDTRRARYTATAIRTCGLFCPMWITRWWNIIDTPVKDFEQ